jgi:hypothetical protein
METETQITQADGTEGKRGNCGSCMAAQREQRGQLLCRAGPPGRGPTGTSFWPTVAPTDWCMKWSPIDG